MKHCSNPKFWHLFAGFHEWRLRFFKSGSTWLTFIWSNFCWKTSMAVLSVIVMHQFSFFDWRHSWCWHFFLLWSLGIERLSIRQGWSRHQEFQRCHGSSCSTLRVGQCQTLWQLACRWRDEGSRMLVAAQRQRPRGEATAKTAMSLWITYRVFWRASTFTASQTKLPWAEKRGRDITNRSREP